MAPTWPTSPRYEDWSATCDTLHAHTQVLVKLAAVLAPPEPQPFVPARAGREPLRALLTGRPRVRSGREFPSVALGSALVGWLVGTLFESAFGIVVP